MDVQYEYNTKPKKLILNDPLINVGLKELAGNNLARYNFRSKPKLAKLNDEFSSLVKIVKSRGIDIVSIEDFLDSDDLELLLKNPNSIFTRDPIITLPWANNTAIMANMLLEGRKEEPSLIKKVLIKNGVTDFISLPEGLFLEGGDVIPVTLEGEKILFIGIGSRTSLKSARWLTKILFEKKMIDRTVCIFHNGSMLHLDTCFCILPNRVILRAKNSIYDFLIIDRQREESVKGLEYLASKGFKVIVEQDNYAIEDEDCNLLDLGNNIFLSFKMPKLLSEKIEKAAKIKLLQIEGAEIAKANGGAHCLTNPIYL